MDFEAILREKGYKITPKRQAILQIFVEDEKHLLTAAEVYERVQEPPMNYSTVYRNLEILTAAGILNRIHREDGVNYFELNVHEHHHHLICLDCGEAKSLFYCPIDELKQRLQQEQGFTPVEHKLEIYGYCSGCQTRREHHQKKTE